MYRQLGATMADSNNYTNWAAFQLYDTSGSVEDWSYWNTGGLGFTFEIGTVGFHPPFETGVVAEYLGLPPAAGAGFGGNRAAYYTMADATVDSALHSTITGTTQRNRKLTVSKTFISATSPVLDEDGNEGPRVTTRITCPRRTTPRAAPSAGRSIPRPGRSWSVDTGVTRRARPSLRSR